MFLSARFGRPNRRGMSDLTVDSQLFHQLQKSLHRPSRFDAYTHRAGKRGIKLPHAVAFVRESPIHYFPCSGVQHRQRLLASVQITSSFGPSTVGVNTEQFTRAAARPTSL